MEDFVSFEIATKLKEKGFEWVKITTYNPKTKVRNNHLEPTISQVLKWLRDEKKLHIEFVGNACGYLYIVSDIPSEGGTDRYCSDYSGPNDGGTWDKYEDCALNAIQYVLDNLI